MDARSVRRFEETQEIGRDVLEGLIGVARLSPSAANLQPLKYRLVDDGAEKAALYPALSWAGYLKDWPGPDPGERPGGYIVITRDRELKAIDKLLMCDVGIVGMAIQLRAREIGLGCCMIASFTAGKLVGALKLPEQFEPLLVLALGTPKERVVPDDLAPGGGIEYYRDASRVHHVPKRTLAEVIIEG